MANSSMPPPCAPPRLVVHHRCIGTIHRATLRHGRTGAHRAPGAVPHRRADPRAVRGRLAAGRRDLGPTRRATGALASRERTVPVVRTLTAVPGRRSVVDYSLQRRAVLADVYAGRTGLFEVCDASPYLSRAAKYHGEATEVACPVCRKERLTRVNYVYGDQLGPTSGQAKTEAELARMDAMQEQFTVYEVEVCRSCGWNHLDCLVRPRCRTGSRAAARRSRRRVGHRVADGGPLRPGVHSRAPVAASRDPPLPQLKTPRLTKTTTGDSRRRPRSQRGVPACHPTTRPRRSRRAPDRSAVRPRRRSRPTGGGRRRRPAPARPPAGGRARTTASRGGGAGPARAAGGGSRQWRGRPDRGQAGRARARAPRSSAATAG